VLVGAGLGLLTVSDGFIYLVLQRRASIDPRWFPLMFIGTAATYLVLAVPLGKLADRVGRHKVFAAGYASLLGAYLLLLADAPAPALVVACLALHGIYYAATDGVLMALTSSVLEGSLRTSGIGIVTTAVSLARFASSLAFGALWLAMGERAPVLIFAAALGVSLPFFWRTLRAVS
jgi:MFS family permease